MDYADFGRYLSQQRELRGMSRGDVAAATKISESLIGALETGQVDRLPGRIFVVNYIRAYAQVIGLSVEEALLRYEEVDRAQTLLSPLELERQRRRRAVQTAGLVALAAAVAGAVGFYLLNLPAGK